MRVVHWSISNHSGMNNVAESFVEGEKKLGIDSVFCEPVWAKRDTWIYDADINVIHTDLPEEVRRKGKAVVYVVHGTPEHVFQTAVEQSQSGYGHHDAWMLTQHWMKLSDATVTFWPRHQSIWKGQCQKRTLVVSIPLGVDKEFWKSEESRGKYLGKPSVLTAENCHQIKWPLDLFFAWPLVWNELMNARLHAVYVPKDQHRLWFPLANANDCNFASYITGGAISQEDLRNAFASTDFYCGLVRYGDFNRTSHEANACGAKTISYEDNPYSQFWIREGDHRRIAEQLIAILKGQVEPRADRIEVPSLEEQCKAMKEEVYERL